jgi:2'-5' RNA ligase
MPFTLNEVYWTCFANSFVNPEKLHVTHKYLGHLSDDEADAAEKLISTVLKPIPGILIAYFTEKRMFGPNSDVPVMVANIDFDPRFRTLRSLLDLTRKDDFDSYNPHVTGAIDPFAMVFDRYYLMVGDEIFASWELNFTRPALLNT